MPKLHVVSASTRPGRLGLPIARWATQVASEHARFDVELVDLAEVGLPMLDEPGHPRMRRYVNEHTQRWSASVEAADAFVFVTPEYNYGPPPSLLNAIDYLHNEWLYKSVGFVSYGGVAAGLRSVQALKQVVTTLKMMPIPEGVAIPFVFQHVSEDSFASTPMFQTAAIAMLDELLRWTEALTDLRKSPPPPPPPPPPGMLPPGVLPPGEAPPQP